LEKRPPEKQGVPPKNDPPKSGGTPEKWGPENRGAKLLDSYSSVDNSEINNSLSIQDAHEEEIPPPKKTEPEILKSQKPEKKEKKVAQKKETNAIPDLDAIWQSVESAKVLPRVLSLEQDPDDYDWDIMAFVDGNPKRPPIATPDYIIVAQSNKYLPNWPPHLRKALGRYLYRWHENGRYGTSPTLARENIGKIEKFRQASAQGANWTDKDISDAIIDTLSKEGVKDYHPKWAIAKRKKEADAQQRSNNTGQHTSHTAEIYNELFDDYNQLNGGSG